VSCIVLQVGPGRADPARAYRASGLNTSGRASTNFFRAGPKRAHLLKRRPSTALKHDGLASGRAGPYPARNHYWSKDVGIESWTRWTGQARTKEMGRKSEQRSWKAGRDGDCCRCTSVFPLSHVHTSTLSSHYSPRQAWLPWLLQQYSTSDETARREKRVDPAHVQATTGYYSTSDESRGTEEPQREDEPRSRSVRELNERAAARRL
jgi:hypothetical protein